jgi:hypothetical protein
MRLDHPDDIASKADESLRRHDRKIGDLGCRIELLIVIAPRYSA